MCAGVLVAAIVAEPDVEAGVRQDERERFLHKHARGGKGMESSGGKGIESSRVVPGALYTKTCLSTLNASRQSRCVCANAVSNPVLMDFVRVLLAYSIYSFALSPSFCAYELRTSFIALKNIPYCSSVTQYIHIQIGVE